MKKMCFKRFISVFLSLGVFLSSLTCTNTNNVEAAEPYEIAYFPGSIVHISQGANGQYSHKNTNAYDCCKNNNYVAPFSGTIVSINRDYNAVILQSDNPVYYADGSCDYMSVFLAHDNNISDLYVGKHLNQGDVFYQPGVKSPKNNVTGAHAHIAVGRGLYLFKNNTNSGNVNLENAFYLRPGTVISSTSKVKTGWRYKEEPVRYKCQAPAIETDSTNYGKKVVRFYTSEPDANIHYITNWGEGYVDSGGSIELYTSSYIRACTVKKWDDSYDNSDFVETNIEVCKLSKPEISTKYTENGILVEMRQPNGGEIHYTTDGTMPNENSPMILNSGAITITKNTKVRVITTARGYINSDEEMKNITVAVPSTPSISLYNTESKIAVGDPVTVNWSSLATANSYTVSLYKNNKLVEQKTTTGTIESFVLNEAGTYTIKVKARNFVGEGSESYPPVSVTAMEDVTVNFVDYDGNAIAKQTVKYGHEATAPSVPLRKGYTFTGWNSLEFRKATKNVTITALYEINKYAVKFYDTDGKTLLSTQKIEYLKPATPPSESKCTISEGYAFSGWHVDYSSDGEDYTSVEGDMKLIATQSWANKDLPIILKITECYRDDNGKTYSAKVHVLNSNLGNANYRLVATLRAANGKALKSVIQESYSDNATEGDVPITINYTDRATSFDVVAVGYDNDFKTGGTLSKQVSSGISARKNIYWGDWSEWSETIPVNQGGSNVSDFMVESKTQYSGRTKFYADSNNSYMDGFELRYDVNNPDVNYGAWSGNQKTTTYPNPSDCCQIVDEYNEYNYFHHCNKKTTSSGWRITTSASGYYDTLHFHTVRSGLPYNSVQSGFKAYGYGGSSTTDGCDRGVNIWFPVGTRFSGDGSDTTCVHYYEYQTRSKTYVYHFWRWNDWSAWADGNPGGDEVRTRTLYRYRYQYTDNISDPNAGVENSEGTQYSISGKLNGVEKDFNGKNATVMVYKKTNTDPTEEQLEYVNQITMGENNSYSFDFIPREEISELTGDYIVALGLEGADKPVNIDIINAPKSEYTVTFMADGEVLSTQKVEQNGSAIIPNVPKKDGYVFEKWNEKTTNINEDTVISAIYKKNAYTVVFVDYENNDINVASYEYGAEITPPTSADTVGKTFIGWDGITGNTYTVTGNAVFEAKWNTKTFTVQFVDDEDNVVSEQQVEYGKSATLPDAIEVSGMEFKGWDTSVNWWNVDSDVVVKPILVYEKTVEVPMYVNYSGHYDYNVLAFDCSTSDAEIYYTLDGTEPNETSEKYNPDEGLIFYDDITVCAYAVCSGYNDSEIITFNVEYEGLSDDYLLTESELGDVNSDGKVDNEDAALILKYSSGIDVDINTSVADYNKDNTIDIRDAIAILNNPSES